MGYTIVVMSAMRYTSELKVAFVVPYSSVYVLQSLYMSGSVSVHLEKRASGCKIYSHSIFRVEDVLFEPFATWR